MHRLKRHLLLTGFICVAVLFAVPVTAMADPPLPMKVTSGTMTVSIADGGMAFDVLKGKAVTLAPDTTGVTTGEITEHLWSSPTNPDLGDGATLDLSTLTGTAGRTIYTCQITSNAGVWIARVAINVVDPEVAGPDVVFPGSQGTYEVTVASSDATELYNNYTFSWSLVPKDASYLDGALRASGVDSWTNQSLTLQVLEHANAWMLYGAELKYEVSVNGESMAGYTKPLKIGILVKPGSDLAPETVSADEKSETGKAFATLELDSVFGGNDTADLLKYSWQMREGGSEWSNAANFGAAVTGDPLTFKMEVDSDTWSGATDFRCLVDLNGAADPALRGESVLFEVRRSEGTLVLSKTVETDPDKPIIVDKQPTASDIVTATGRILVPANRETGDTVYTAKVLIKDGGEWVEIPGAVNTFTGTMKPDDTIDVTFAPSLGIHEYKLRVSSDADGEPVDEKTFEFTVADKNIRVKVLTFPPQNDIGRIEVNYGQAITYKVEPTGGSGRWIVVWKESLTGISLPTDLFDLNRWIEELRALNYGDDWVNQLLNNLILTPMQRSEKTIFVHNIPIQDMPVVATVYAVDHNGEPIMTGPVPNPQPNLNGGDNGEEEFPWQDIWDQWETWPCLKADVNSFGMPWVFMEWSVLPGDTVIDLDSLLDDDPEWIGWLRAKGGTTGLMANYWYSLNDGDWTLLRFTLPLSLLPECVVGLEGGLPDISSWLAPFGMYFSANADMFRDYDLEDGRSQRFSVRFKVEDLGGQVVISDPITLTLLQGTAILGIDGAEWDSGRNAYEAEYRQGNPVTLTAELYGLDEDGVSYSWTLDGEEVGEGPVWTPPADLEASDEPYVVTVEAQLGDKVLDSVEVELTVLPIPGFTASAAFDPSTVSADDVAVLKIRASAGSGNYVFEAGGRTDDLMTLTANPGGDTADWSFAAPNIDGTFTYCWKVTDTATGAVKEGTADLETVNGEVGDVVEFTLRPPRSATKAKGTEFETVIENTGSKWVTATDLTWSSNRLDIAMVDYRGVVSIVGTGEVTITATVTGSDPAIYDDMTFTATGEAVDYEIILPDLTEYRGGDEIDVWITSEPEGATFAYDGTLPGELTLSSDGHLTGTLPPAGTYLLDGTFTVTWPDGHVETYSDIEITVPRRGGGGGGGCDGGFGFFGLALALGAFLTLKRK